MVRCGWRVLALVLLVAAVAISSCGRDPLTHEEQEIAFYGAVVSCTEEQTGQEYGDVTRLGDMSAPDAALADAFDIYIDCYDRVLMDHPEWPVDGPDASSTPSVPTPTGQPAAELQARAMTRAWSDWASDGEPACMHGPSASAELRAAITVIFPVDVEYYQSHDDIKVDAVDFPSDYRCTALTPQSVEPIHGDVVAVEVGVVRGDLAGRGVDYLFRWDGSAWVDTTAEETGVTVTSWES